MLNNLYNMEVIVLLISVSLLLASIFLGAFIWAQVNGQYEDDQSPAVRMLMDDEQTITSNNRTKQ
ncbi:cytochrome oxidase maturation protein, cbb3-type [Lishizhenia tianjinensis]|uniref:Cytochrome oxidase maturation protein, cbb3-type n=2 Tax=Crocinitomicaceae TaxID=1853230 RepID=A0A1I7B8X8_9FLAO|nr:cytochrome oxidase maturation protein, cbb3-type [Lishizhenia tianjinensis]